jgi:hypothetical protein
MNSKDLYLIRGVCGNPIIDIMQSATKGLTTTNISSSQMKIIHYFENYPLKSGGSMYSFNNNNPYSTIYLSQSSFATGTVRITCPGYYVLLEDIAFHPNPTNDFKPTQEQILSGQYPKGPGAYNLDFFAALTVESEDVFIDMRGHTIQQSYEHFIMQRFYANIELASAPFIGAQGPSPGISAGHASANRCAIVNGHLSLSSHHGIHGNSARNLLLAGLTINDFQVGGISLNGLNNGVFYDINVRNANKQTPILSTFSQAIFTLPWLKRLTHKEHWATINIKGVYKDAHTSETNLTKSLMRARKELIKTHKTSDPLYSNPGGLSDTNIYGISINVNGVLVNSFLEKRPLAENTGNQDIYMENICIQKISSKPLQIIGLSDASVLNKAVDCYGKGRPLIVGPVGGLLKHREVTGTNGKYISNPLVDAQALLALHVGEGTSFYTRSVIDWLAGDIRKSQLMAERNISEVFGLDSMAHTMKGNIGLFISGGLNIKCLTVSVANIENEGNFEKVGGDTKHAPGEKAFTYAFVACENVKIDDETYNGTTFLEA